MSLSSSTFLQPPIPADEDRRLQTLEELQILDTEPEEAFDRITRNLAQIFQTPISLISLVDKDRQWWKSKQGLPPDLDAAGQTERSVSVCGHVVGNNQSLSVDDLAIDPRFADNPLVKKYGIRLYAGAPLRTDDGLAMGSLCVIDTKPGHVTDREMQMLEMISDAVMMEVKLRSLSRKLLELNEKITNQNRIIESDLQRARIVQRCLLPAACVKSGPWTVMHVYRPMEQIGGDYLDVLVRPDGSVFVLLADVMGHGAGAALVAAMVKTSFLRNAPVCQAPHILLTAVQHDLSSLTAGDLFVSALAVLLPSQDGPVVVASAGHPHPIIHHASPGGAEVIRLEGDVPLLILPNHRYVRSQPFPVQPGDSLLLCTDGAYEVNESANNMLGIDGLARLLHEAGTLRGDALLESLFSRISTMANDKLNDDVALVYIERR